MVTHYFLRFIAALFAIIIFSSCATSKKQYTNMDLYLHQRNFDKAIAQIESAKDSDYSKNDRVLFYLDLGMLKHYSGSYKESNELLTSADEAMEDLYTKSVSKAIGSAILNDNVKEYSGDDYEFVFVNVFKCLNYINLLDKEGALVEIKKINNKLKLLNDKYDMMSADNKKAEITRFYSSTLAYYLSFILYRMENNFDDAEIDKKYIIKTIENQKHIYDFIQENSLGDITSTEKPKKGEGRVNIVAFTGVGPEKIAKRLNLGILPDMIVIHYDEGDERYRKAFGFATLPLPCIPPSCPLQAYYFKFEFPELKQKTDKTAADEIKLFIDGKETKSFTKLENIAKIAEMTFNNNINMTIGKTITRAVIKYLAVVIAAEVTKAKVGGVGGQLAGLALGLGGSAAASASENADLRMSYFFPALSFAAETDIAAGKHNIEIRYYKNGAVLYEDKREIEIKGGDYHLIESFEF